MTKQDKVMYAQKNMANTWKCPDDSFIKNENIIIKTDQAFFEIITFGYNAVIRTDKEIFKWCIENFSQIKACHIMDGENLYMIEKKMREYGKKLAGEHIHYLHLYPEIIVKKPIGFSFELYEGDKIHTLYNDNRFDSALNYDTKGEILAIVAKKDNNIASIVAVDNYHQGFWQIGVDTIEMYRGNGLATYLVKEMALEGEKRGMISFYTTWSSNIASTRTALCAGFSPVWIKYHAENV